MLVVKRSAVARVCGNLLTQLVSGNSDDAEQLKEFSAGNPEAVECLPRVLTT